MRRPPAVAVGAAVLLLVMVAAPFAAVAVAALHSGFGGGPWTLANFRDLVGQPVYGTVLARTFGISAVVVPCCVAVGVLYGVCAWQARPAVSRVLTFAAAVPLLLSLVVTTFAWFELLAYHSVLAGVLTRLHLAGSSLLGTRAAAIIGIVYLCLPINALTTVLGLRQVRADTLLAAYSMGAGRFTVVRTVALPAAAPSIASGALLSFVVAIGAYLVPEVLGGPHNTFVTYLIISASTQSLDPGLASALATVLVVASLPAILVIGGAERWTRS